MHIGVDTHKKRHVLVALDARGQACGTPSVANTPTGWAAALRWTRDRDTACVWGIENSGSLGKGFSHDPIIYGPFGGGPPIINDEIIRVLC